MASTKKKRKIEDEHRKFLYEWTDSYAFIQNHEGFPTCLICQEKLAHNKKSNLERHFTRKHDSFAKKYPAGVARKLAVEGLLNKYQITSSLVHNWTQSSNNINVASFKVSYEIAKRGKPFTDGDYIKQCFIKASEDLFVDFKNKNEIIKKIQDLPLSAKTVQDRSAKMALDVTEQQLYDIKLTSAISIAVGVEESDAVKDTAQVVLYVRFISPQGPKEELLGLLPLDGQTRGEDIANAVLNCLEKHDINVDTIVSIATDGVKSMTGINKGFVTILKNTIDHEILSFHCIVHQEALCVQTFPEEIVDVMNLVIKITNSIVAKSPRHHEFKEILDEVDHQYSDLLLHNKVRWLSRGNVLRHFASRLQDIDTFLRSKGIYHTELQDDRWLRKFYFMTDVTSYFNELNLKLQGKGNTAFSLLEEVVSFEKKFELLAEDIEMGTLLHFETLKKYRDDKTHREINIDANYFIKAINTMKNQFAARFQQLKANKPTLAFVENPLLANSKDLNFSPFDINVGSFQMQLLDLKCKDLWSSKFKNLNTCLEELQRVKSSLASQHKWTALSESPMPEKLIFDAWNSLPASYDELKKMAFGVLTIFGSTYSCEQLFSSMNFIKSKLRSQISNENLEAGLKLKTTTYMPNIHKHSNQMQGQRSH